jgi:hypothetical protein
MACCHKFRYWWTSLWGWKKTLTLHQRSNGQCKVAQICADRKSTIESTVC